MKTFGCVVLLGMLGALGSGVAEDKPPFKHKVAADFKACPDGHKELVDIPILYGLFGLHYKKPADYNDEDRKLAERVKKGKVVLGGDLIPANPPTMQVRCKRCGFEFSPWPEPVADPEYDTWDKSEGRPDDFKIPFSKTLLRFPLMQPVKGSLSYSQSLDAGGKFIKTESLSFRTASKIDEVLKTVREWMSQNKRDPVDLKRITNAAAYHCYDYGDNYISLNVQDDTYWNPGQICVWLSLRPQEAGKPKLTIEMPLSSPTSVAPGLFDPFAPSVRTPAPKETAPPPLPDNLWQDPPQLELILDYHGGWNPSYDLRINLDSGEVDYTPRNDALLLKPFRLPDSKKVSTRVKALAAHIPTDHSVGHFSEDSPVYHVTFRDGKSVKHFSIIAGPHEGEPPEAYTLCDLLDEIVAQSKRAK